MSKRIVTISREYGSGGRQVGQMVAKNLGMEFYDKKLIDLAAKEIGFSPELIADKEQRVTCSITLPWEVYTGLPIREHPSLKSFR